MSSYQKYSPKALNDVVMAPTLCKILSRMQTKGMLENMLFFGRPGVGKSVIARLISTNVTFIQCDGDISHSDCMNSARKSARSINLEDDSRKLIVFDELDCWDSRQQAKVRALIDETSAVATFIATTNNADKIIEPLRSRMFGVCIDDHLSNLSVKLLWKERLATIFQLENGTAATKADLDRAMQHFPDGRRMTVELLSM
jgi:replication-associated recombination protein RarA